MKNSTRKTLLVAAMLAAATTLTPCSATPTWMGVYDWHLHLWYGRGAEIFSVMLNDDYEGLHVDIGIRIDEGDWEVYPMQRGSSFDGNRKWNHYSSRLPAESSVEFFYHAWDEWGFDMWDVNWGYNYSFTTATVKDVKWIGNTWQDEQYGSYIGDSRRVYTETWPAKAAKNAYLIYSVAGSDEWDAIGMYNTGISYNNDIWVATIHSYLGITGAIDYAIMAIDSFGNVLWDNNNGSDFHLPAQQ